MWLWCHFSLKQQNCWNCVESVIVLIVMQMRNVTYLWKAILLQMLFWCLFLSLDSPDSGDELLGALDLAFLFSYAVSMFFRYMSFIVFTQGNLTSQNSKCLHVIGDEDFCWAALPCWCWMSGRWTSNSRILNKYARLTSRKDFKRLVW